MNWSRATNATYVEEKKLITRLIKIAVGQPAATGLVKLPVASGVRLFAGLQGRREITRRSRALGDVCQQMPGRKGIPIGR